MEKLEGGNFVDLIKDQLTALQEWLKPEPEDNLLLKIIKGIFKALALLVLVILSPVMLVILAFVFFAVL